MQQNDCVRVCGCLRWHLATAENMSSKKCVLEAVRWEEGGASHQQQCDHQIHFTFFENGSMFNFEFSAMKQNAMLISSQKQNMFFFCL